MPGPLKFWQSKTDDYVLKVYVLSVFQPTRVGGKQIALWFVDTDARLSFAG